VPKSTEKRVSCYLGGETSHKLTCTKTSGPEQLSVSPSYAKRMTAASDKVLPKIRKTYCSPIEILLYMGIQ
jgi:hypothetical protein